MQENKQGQSFSPWSLLKAFNAYLELLSSTSLKENAGKLLQYSGEVIDNIKELANDMFDMCKAIATSKSFSVEAKAKLAEVKDDLIETAEDFGEVITHTNALISEVESTIDKLDL